MPLAARARRRWPKRLARRPGVSAVGTLVGINDSGQPLVRYPRDIFDRVMLARTTVRITREQLEREVVIVFEGGDVARPIVVGVLLQLDERTQPEPRAHQPTVSRPSLQATLDGDRLVLTGQNEIVLRCGKASLTLTRAGKVLLRGSYVLSHSAGVNRIRGGSVQIN